MKPLLMAMVLPIVAVLPALAGPAPSAPDPVALNRLSLAGETLPAEVAAQFPLPEQDVKDDTGVNVLIDLAHQASFFTMWQLPKELRAKGFRVCGSQAALDSALAPDKASRVRLPVGDRRPFAWRPNDRFNVVITVQTNPNCQEYPPEEQAALEAFVRAGGGLLIVGGKATSAEDLERWPLNGLASRFGATLTSEADTVGDLKTTALKLGAEWEATIRGAAGRVVVARRSLGKGRIVLIGSSALISWPNDKQAGAQQLKAERVAFLADTVTWAAAGAPPVGGSLRLPKEASGGGPIYPELEQRVGAVVVYYAKNQKPELLQTVNVDMPTVKKQLEEWLPSAAPDEPMYLILSAGGGGGWAVNAYLPKEVGTISLEGAGVLSVLAHELAHTMGGPPNDKGQVAGRSPFGNQGESHAGWFQGKILARRTGERKGHDPNKVFTFDKDGTALDLALSRAEYDRQWKKGNDWVKTWWIWQKLDDRYGPTWYPRWKWVQHTRWADEPNRNLTWDETIEDMSIAVGEDLFPFFRKIGTTLAKERFTLAEFRGEKIELPVAPIEITPAGPARLEPIGDYTKPLSASR